MEGLVNVPLSFIYRPNQTFPDRRAKETFKQKMDVTPNQRTVVAMLNSQSKDGHEELISLLDVKEDTVDKKLVSGRGTATACS